ncbi:unnamed protein product [Closterium sp. Yama58-4]|nr:unnamed protein product [Closterium sp. Yama58-4]
MPRSALSGAGASPFAIQGKAVSGAGRSMMMPPRNSSVPASLPTHKGTATGLLDSARVGGGAGGRQLRAFASAAPGRMDGPAALGSELGRRDSYNLILDQFLSADGNASGPDSPSTGMGTEERRGAAEIGGGLELRRVVTAGRAQRAERGGADILVVESGGDGGSADGSVHGGGRMHGGIRLHGSNSFHGNPSNGGAAGGGFDNTSSTTAPTAPAAAGGVAAGSVGDGVDYSSSFESYSTAAGADVARDGTDGDSDHGQVNGQRKIRGQAQGGSGNGRQKHRRASISAVAGAAEGGRGGGGGGREAEGSFLRRGSGSRAVAASEGGAGGTGVAGGAVGAGGAGGAGGGAGGGAERGMGRATGGGTGGGGSAAGEGEGVSGAGSSGTHPGWGGFPRLNLEIASLQSFSDEENPSNRSVGSLQGMGSGRGGGSEQGMDSAQSSLLNSSLGKGEGRGVGEGARRWVRGGREGGVEVGRGRGRERRGKGKKGVRFYSELRSPLVGKQYALTAVDWLDYDPPGDALLRRCVHRATGTPLTCRTISKQSIRSQQQAEAIGVEVAVLEVLQPHAHIIGLKDKFESLTSVHLILDPVSRLSLHDRMRQHGPIPQHHAAPLCLALLHALHHCHSQGVAHRNLTPHAVVFPSDDSPLGDARLSGFECAAFVTPGVPFSDPVTPPLFAAPEVHAGMYGTQADLWSLGVLLFLLLCGGPPFWSATAGGIRRAVQQQQVAFLSPRWKDVSDEMKQLLLLLLEKNPAERLTASDALEHPLFTRVAASEEGTP